MEINILPKNEKINLSDNCFAVDYKKTLVHQVITSYFSNARENYSSQKNRSEVRGGGKKPWKQKGTGRARAGTTRGPIWRGGGVTFASGKRNFSEKINKKMYNGAMRSIMSELLRTDRVIAIDKIDLKEVKTKEMNNILKEHNLKSVLIVTNEIDEKLFLSARNIKDVGIATVDYLDPPLMLSYKKVLIVKDALISFEKRFGG
ncbi:MAG: 50S ribosomal protein L4 [Gammaproteobacteria bacterium]|jgi:large subunit ribosomal protein L4|nr:50S ribosomal protein L4 [Gammaproteobacteria bacterium]|tara:strand:- start:2840 stop:3448 length:609 start_codon:yes stop_codon:yes gene_type:complete